MNPHFLRHDLAHRLGYAGLIPFVLLTLGVWLVDPFWLDVFIKAQLAYAILIFAFLGGVHWGMAVCSTRLNAQQTRRAMLWSVTPTLAGWLATMIGGYGFAMLMLGFGIAYQVDKRLFQWVEAPSWLIGLRFKLTCVVIAALALTVIAANVRG